MDIKYLLGVSLVGIISLQGLLFTAVEFFSELRLNGTHFTYGSKLFCLSESSLFDLLSDPTDIQTEPKNCDTPPTVHITILSWRTEHAPSLSVLLFPAGPLFKLNSLYLMSQT